MRMNKCDFIYSLLIHYIFCWVVTAITLVTLIMLLLRKIKVHNRDNKASLSKVAFFSSLLQSYRDWNVKAALKKKNEKKKSKSKP